MRTEKLLEMVKERGLRIELVDGRPVLKYPANGKHSATDKLLVVLKYHRERIIELLSPTKVTQKVLGESPIDTSFNFGANT